MTATQVPLVIPELLRTLSKLPSKLSLRLTNTSLQTFGARLKSSSLHLPSGLISSKSMERSQSSVLQEEAVAVTVVAAVEAVVAVEAVEYGKKPVVSASRG